jgi:hypothetical protein
VNVFSHARVMAMTFGTLKFLNGRAIIGLGTRCERR